MKSIATLLALLPAAALLPGTALAAYPEQPITYIVPYGAGGGNDTGTRTWAPYLEACLGGTIVIVNKPGAGGELGFAELANAKPDGYTLGSVATPNMPLGAITKSNAAYDIDSFTYLSNVYGSNSTISGKKGGRFSTLEDVIAAGKEAPLTWGISGFGSDDHLMGLKFMSATGVKLTFIPLADAAGVRNAVLGGHIDVGGLSIAESSPFQADLQTFAVASENETPLLPGVKTFREQGIDLVGGSLPLIAAPKGVPEEVVTKVSDCFKQIVADPKFQAEAQQRKLLLVPMDAAKTDAYARSEYKALKELWDANPWGN